MESATIRRTHSRSGAGGCRSQTGRRSYTCCGIDDENHCAARGDVHVELTAAIILSERATIVGREDLRTLNRSPLVSPSQ